MNQLKERWHTNMDETGTDDRARRELLRDVAEFTTANAYGIAEFLAAAGSAIENGRSGRAPGETVLSAIGGAVTDKLVPLSRREIELRRAAARLGNDGVEHDLWLTERARMRANAAVFGRFFVRPSAGCTLRQVTERLLPPAAGFDVQFEICEFLERELPARLFAGTDPDEDLASDIAAFVFDSGGAVARFSEVRNAAVGSILAGVPSRGRAIEAIAHAAARELGPVGLRGLRLWLSLTGEETEGLRRALHGRVAALATELTGRWQRAVEQLRLGLRRGHGAARLAEALLAIVAESAALERGDDDVVDQLGTLLLNAIDAGD